MQVLDKVTIDKVEVSTNRDKIHVEGWLHFSADGGNGIDCTLTKDEYGHFTSAREIFIIDNESGGFTPHLDVN